MARYSPAAPTLTLVLVGPQEDAYRAVKAAAVREGFSRWSFPGYVRSQDLPAVYSAALFVFLLYEGFGLPPLEAMACGTLRGLEPRLCPRHLSGGASFNPTSVEQMVYAVGGDAARVITLRQEGFRQSAMFNWRTAAEQTLEVYRAALAATPR